MSQFISLEQAVAMTTLYRQEKENILATAYKGQNILARCETFDQAYWTLYLQKPVAHPSGSITGWMKA